MHKFKFFIIFFVLILIFLNVSNICKIDTGNLYVILEEGGIFFQHLAIINAIQLSKILKKQLFIINQTNTCIFNYNNHYKRIDIKNVPKNIYMEITPHFRILSNNSNRSILLTRFTGTSYLNVKTITNTVINIYDRSLRRNIINGLLFYKKLRVEADKILANIKKPFYGIQIRTNMDWLKLTLFNKNSVAWVTENEILKSIPYNTNIFLSGQDVDKNPILKNKNYTFFTKGLCSEFSPNEKAIIEYLVCIESELFIGNIFSSFYFCVKEYRRINNKGNSLYYNNIINIPSNKFEYVDTFAQKLPIYYRYANVNLYNLMIQSYLDYKDIVHFETLFN